MRAESVFIHDIDVWFVLTTSKSELPNYYPRYGELMWWCSKFFTLVGIPLSTALGITSLHWLGVLKLTRDRVMLSIASMLFTAFLVEVFLRTIGFVPGQFQYNQWVQKVDELYTLNGFTADENGIFKVDTTVTQQIKTDLDGQKFLPENMGRYCSENTITPEAAAVYKDFVFLEETNCEFSKKVSALDGSYKLNNLDSLILAFSTNPVNEEGFFSIPFVPVNDGPRILMLGDSFTWGHSTSNKASSFANTLLSRGYVVYNTGLSGSDIPQYNAVLRHYEGTLEPDIVVLNLFIGNDVVPYEREVSKGQPIHYTTNAGNILGFQAGKQYTTMQAAYENVMNNMVVPRTSLFNRLASKTVITGFVWAVGVRLMLIDHQFTKFPPSPEVPESRGELLKLMSYCQNRRLPLIISIIPELNNGKLAGSQKYPNVFSNLIFHEPEMSLEHYDLTDGHFNDTGHLYYADYLEKLILDKLNH